MTYSRMYVFWQGETSQTLAAQIMDDDGNDVGSEITSVVELGNGWYQKKVTTIPDDHEGSIKFYKSGAASTPEMVFSIFPDEGERLDRAITEILTTAMAEDYAADNTEATAAELFYMIWGYLRHRERSGTTLTVDGLDGTTVKMTFDLDNESSPTSQERAS